MTFRPPSPTIRDITQLRRLASGQTLSFFRGEALRLLATSRFPNRHRDLEIVLANEQEPLGLRCLAATLLGQQANDTALRILVNQAPSTTPDVLDQIVRAVGQIGDDTALEALDRIGASAPARIADQARFASVLIAYRHGLGDHTVELPERSRCLHIPQEHRLPVAVEIPHGKDLDSSLLAVAVEPYGIEFDERHASQLSFERDRWILLLNRTVLEAFERLRRKKALLGVVVERVALDPEYVVALIILSTPAEGAREVRLHLHDLDGDLLYLGDAHVHEPRVGFSVETLARPVSIPLEIEGELTEEGLSLSSVSTTTLRGWKRYARPFVRSANSP